MAVKGETQTYGLSLSFNYRKVTHLKSYCMVRYINSVGPKNAGNVENISPSSSIHSNLY